MLRVNGLYGHTQRNNAKTLALMALFLLLIEGTQVALRMMPVAAISNINRQLPPWPEGQPSMVEFKPNGTFYSKRSATPETIATTPGRPALAAATAEGDGPTALLPVVKGAEQQSWSVQRLPSEAPRPERAAHLERRTLAFISNPWLIALVGGLLYILGSCFWSARLIGFETRARPLQRRDAPELYNLVENLAISIGLPCPRIEVIESPALNAYAAGFFPKSSTIAVTRGLIQALSRDELEAVLAHELTHIRDRDVRLMVVVRACADLALPVSRTVMERIKRKPFVDGMFGLLILAYLGPRYALLFAAIFAVIAVIGFGVRFAISQTREFTADAGAIELTKNPSALISALRKVALNDALPLKGYATRAMMFSSTVKTWLRTHPPIEDRIAAIKRHGGGAEQEDVDSCVASRAEAAAEPRVAFGRKRVMHGLGRPIAEPPIMVGMEATDTNRLSRMDQAIAIGAIGTKVILLPFTLVRYFLACSITFGLLATLLAHNPLLGLAAVAFCAWLLFRNLSRFGARMMRSFGNAGVPRAGQRQTVS